MLTNEIENLQFSDKLKHKDLLFEDICNFDGDKFKKTKFIGFEE